MPRLEEIKNFQAAEIADIIRYAIKVRPGEVEMMLVNGYLRDRARQNDKREAWLASYVPDTWIKNIAGIESLVDLYVTLRIPRELLEERLKPRGDINPRTDDTETGALA